MAKALTIGEPRHPAMSAAHERDRKEMLVPHVEALPDEVEAAGRDMDLAARRLKPA
ncbi:hypothetical protein ACVDG5_013855 [Mesorhizobium sp. ORM6]